MLPHVRTRSRIILLNEERNSNLNTHWSTCPKLSTHCAQRRNREFDGFVGNSCSRPKVGSIFEKLVRFESAEDKDCYNLSSR